MWFVRSCLLFMAILLAVPVGAHEYWIEPVDFTLDAGEPMKAYLKVGQDMNGSTYPFIPARFTAFEVTVDGRTEDYIGRVGDNPALDVAAPKEGLNIITYESRPDRLLFGKDGLLEKYLKAEGLERVLLAHRAEGLDEAGFSERYIRNAKALVQVGSKAGEDVAVGMPFELVLEGSPYGGAKTGQVQLLWRGKPMPDWPINVFTKQDKVKRTRVQTDGDGYAQIAFPVGAQVLLNSVFIQRSKPESEDLYESWWASLTFGR